jgi:hypothetical protein
MVLSPVTIHTTKKLPPKEPPMTETMGSWRDSWSGLGKSPMLTFDSKLMEEALSSLAGNFVNVTSIVCFGLGPLQDKNGYTAGAHQHMLAFELAAQISVRRLFQRGFRQVTQVVLQDPAYTDQDREELIDAGVRYGVNPLFVSDPDGLLATNKNSIVIAIGLPPEYPLLQICTDLPRPAAFIIDHCRQEQKARKYTADDVSTPKVEGMLWFQYHHMKPPGKTLRSVFTASNDRRLAWLGDVQLYVKKDMETRFYEPIEDGWMSDSSRVRARPDRTSGPGFFTGYLSRGAQQP